MNWYNNMNVCLGFFSSIRNFPTTFYLHGARINFFLDSMFSMFPFYCLCVLWKITLSKQFQKGCSRKPPLIFFFVKCQVCFYFTAHMCLKKRARMFIFFILVSVCILVQEGLMIGLQSQQQTVTFVVCQIGKSLALFVNTSRSLDKPCEDRSGRATYLTGKSSKVRMAPFRYR